MAEILKRQPGPIRRDQGQRNSHDLTDQGNQGHNKETQGKKKKDNENKRSVSSEDEAQTKF